MKPLVSVIIPVYNRELTIERAVRSVLTQTYPSIEVIVVDDCSSDRTMDILNSILDPRLVVVTNEKNLGGSASRNAGLKIARGEFLAFQDSDDEWLPEKLEQQMAVLLNASADYGVIYSREMIMDGMDSRPFPDSRLIATRVISGDVYRELLKGNFVPMIVGVARRECFDLAGGFDESLPRFQDWDFWIRISKRFKFIYLDRCLANVHVTSGSISSNQLAHARALEIILGKYNQDIAADRGLLTYYYHQLGLSFFRAAVFSDARFYFAKEFMTRPSLVPVLYYLGSWLPQAMIPWLIRLTRGVIRR